MVLLLDASARCGKVGSAGRPPLFVDVRTVRPDGTACAPDETGELLASGPNVMAGYWGRARRHTSRDRRATGGSTREMRPGSTTRDSCSLVDRVGEAYEVSGHVVYPGDVERALARHPAVAEAGVTAHDEISEAFVVLAAGRTAGTKTSCSPSAVRILHRTQVPSSVVFVDRLPRNSVGKLLRHELATRR